MIHINNKMAISICATKTQSSQLKSLDYTFVNVSLMLQVPGNVITCTI